MKDNVLSKYTYLIDTTLMIQAQKQTLSVKCIDKLRISTKCLYFFFCPIEMKTNQIQRNSLYDKKFNLRRSSSLTIC